MPRCVSSGSTTARIAIVGEAPGEKEDEKGVPFVGPSGYELGKMLNDAGIFMDSCYLTNVVMDRPPGNDLKLWVNPKKALRDGTEIPYRGNLVRPHVKDDCERLYKELRALKPNLVIACGNTPLWALTGQRGVGKWRGSILESDVISGQKVLPAFHPAAVLRQYDWRFITVQDFRRARAQAEFSEIRKTPRHYVLDPSFETIVETLRVLVGRAATSNIPLDIVTDVEIKRKEILCVGIGWSVNDAICIPFYRFGEQAWTIEQQIVLIELLRELFCHPNVALCNQNLSFDIQYFFWRFDIWPKAAFDTMIAQNVLFIGSPKKLDYLASMYCENYVYWKDDNKFWKEGKPIIYPQLWAYNCDDCCYTFEVMLEQRKALRALGLEAQMAFQIRLFHPVMKMMLRGVSVSLDNKKSLHKEIGAFIGQMEKEVSFITGFDLNIASPKQMQDLFYTRLKLPVQKNKTVDAYGNVKMSPTTDDEALKVLAKKEPLIKPLVERINMVRSYKTALDVCEKKVDRDGRWRTSYNMAGTSTYRFSSSENPFDSGLNLQNLTMGKDIT